MFVARSENLLQNIKILLDLVSYGVDPMVEDLNNHIGTIHVIMLNVGHEPEEAVVLSYGVLDHGTMKRCFSMHINLDY